MPDQTLSLLFFRGTGIAFLLERWACRFPCQPFGLVPGHVAVRINNDVFQALAVGVRQSFDVEALKRPDFICEIVIPGRTDAQIAAARAYAASCVGVQQYSWSDIRLTLWAWAAPAVVARFPHLKSVRSTNRTICSLLALLTLAHADCNLPPFFAPDTTPNELMVRTQDYDFALDTEGATPTTDCKCSSTEET